MKSVIIGICILFGGFIQLFRCLDHASSYQAVSYEFDGSFSPELVYNMDAGKDDLPVKKRKTRIRSVDYFVVFIPSSANQLEIITKEKLPAIPYFHYFSPLLNEHSLRGPPVA